MPTVTPGAARRQHPGIGESRRLADAARLDAHLFMPNRWFVIDRGNRHAGTVPDLGTGLAQVAISTIAEAGLTTDPSPGVASVVGRLRPEVHALDIDLDSPIGDAVAEQAVAWLATRHLWYLIRPSGGGPHRWHIFTVPGQAADDLAEEIARLRTRRKISASSLDLRRPTTRGLAAIRPLQAPHRRTGETPHPLGDLRQALAGLLQHLPDPPAARRPPAKAPRGPAAPALEHPRRARRLSPAWQHYASTGQVPPEADIDPPGTSSGSELLATAHLLRSGYTADQAWTTITTAHPHAWRKAKVRGRGWWQRHVWAHEATTPHTPTSPREPSPDVHATIRHTYHQISAALPTWPDRARWSIAAVGYAICDRALREDTTTGIPVPLRNLQLDTGLSRTTVIAALRALHGVIGTREETFDPTKPDRSSHTWTLDPPHPTQPPPQVSLSTPPRSTPPNPQKDLGQLPPTLTPATPGRWASLSPRCRVLHAHLTLHGPQTTTGLASLCQLATPRQRRTLADHLATLHAAGLAHLDPATNTWTAADTDSNAHQARTAAVRAHLSEQIERERRDYRDRVGVTWRAGRRRAYRAADHRHRSWWDHLPQHERHRRHRDAQRGFATLSEDDKARRKHALARRRGIIERQSETQRHAEWCARHSPADRALISARWTAWSANLPDPIRQARQAHLAVHRHAWNLPPTWADTPTRDTLLAA